MENILNIILKNNIKIKDIVTSEPSLEDLFNQFITINYLTFHVSIEDIKKFHIAPTNAPTIPDMYQVMETSFNFPKYK